MRKFLKWFGVIGGGLVVVAILLIVPSAGHGDKTPYCLQKHCLRQNLESRPDSIARYQPLVQRQPGHHSQVARAAL